MSKYGLSFDVATVLALGSPSSEPLPEAAEGEIILRVPEGISPVSLRGSPIGRDLICQGNTWYDHYAWASTSRAVGVYHLRLPVPGSSYKTFDEQKALLFEGEATAPLVLVELALLCMRDAGHAALANGEFVRCDETGAAGNRAAVHWHGGRLLVSYLWDDVHADYVWLASVRNP